MVAVTSKGTAVVRLPTDTQILITRDFNAPKHLVYKAWTTPELIKGWWSGDRGEVTSADVDLRVGGTWRYVMVANAGFEVAFHGEYREIVPNEHIVSTEIYEAMPDAEAVSTLTLTEADGRTTLTLLVQHASSEQWGRTHQLRHGRRHARSDGPPSAGRRLARLNMSSQP